MEIKRYIFAGLAILTVLGLASCKKDKTEEVKYLTGEPRFSMPAYGVAGDSFSFKVGGVKADDGSEVGYYWYASPVFTDKDTSATYTFTLPDTLCTFTVYSTAYAKDYISTPYSQKITVVKAGREGGSITGLAFDQSKDFSFTDPRDGHEYWCTTVGNTDWFKENLAYEGSGAALENCESTSDVFGRFYSWDEAGSACPEGWRVSSLDDWADAASVILGQRPDPQTRFYGAAGGFMGDLSFNGDKMWEYWPKVKITDQLGLSMIPLGYAVKQETNADFSDMYDYASFWTADSMDADQGYYRYFFDESPDIFLGHASKSSFAANVRCVRDHE